ncbi:MAG TPA: hypothetical protein PKA76_07065 [Pirellulaceae bacterium]|nr:hypothetical protein [Pirellulaceae bacterium]
MTRAIWTPRAMPIVDIRHELADVDTYVLQADDFEFEPGQFNLIYVPGNGEAAISISSDRRTPQVLGHTIRAVGNVTRALRGYQVGQPMWIRGPFGAGWPIDDCVGCDLLIACGGVGVPSLVSKIQGVSFRYH